jgi:uncharacterized Zn ribbon protein
MTVTLKDGTKIVCVKNIEIVDNSAFITCIGEDVYEEYLDDVKTITP